MNKGSQLNKESGVSNEQGVSAEQGSQMNKGSQLNDSSQPRLEFCQDVLQCNFSFVTISLFFVIKVSIQLVAKKLKANYMISKST